MQWTVTYVDAGCRRVEFLSRNGFLWGHGGLYREGWEQVGLSELPFHSGSPRTEKNTLTDAKIQNIHATSQLMI